MKYSFLYLFLSSVGICFVLRAQNKQSADREAILKQSGCYQVTFNYHEIFQNGGKQEISEPYTEKATEWIAPVVNKTNEISLQHILVVNDTMLIKHWRQDWLYENTHLWTYLGKNNWHHKKANSNSVKGQWTQKVYQVDDSPRYDGTATWVHYDGRHYWENTTDAPLPRREFTKRNDYNILQRTNRHEILSNGWKHEQDNVKINRVDGQKEQIIASEKGINTYIKIDPVNCAPAVAWWNKHKNFWGEVQTLWNKVLSGKSTGIKIKTKLEGKKLHEVLFALDKKFSAEKIYPKKQAQREIEQTLRNYVESMP